MELRWGGECSGWKRCGDDGGSIRGVTSNSGGTRRKNRGKTAAEKSRLCFLASATAASLLQRCRWMSVATCTSWMLELKKSTRPTGDRRVLAETWRDETRCTVMKPFNDRRFRRYRVFKWVNAWKPDDRREVGEPKEGRVEEDVGGRRRIGEWGGQPDSTI